MRTTRSGNSNLVMERWYSDHVPSTPTGYPSAGPNHNPHEFKIFLRPTIQYLIICIKVLPAFGLSPPGQRVYWFGGGGNPSFES